MKKNMPCEVFDLKHKGRLGGNKFNYWIIEEDDNGWESQTTFSRKHINYLLDNLIGKKVEIIIREILPEPVPGILINTTCKHLHIPMNTTSVIYCKKFIDNCQDCKLYESKQYYEDR